MPKSCKLAVCKYDLRLTLRDQSLNQIAHVAVESGAVGRRKAIDWAADESLRLCRSPCGLFDAYLFQQTKGGWREVWNFAEYVEAVTKFRDNTSRELDRLFGQHIRRYVAVDMPPHEIWKRRTRSRRCRHYRGTVNHA